MLCSVLSAKSAHGMTNSVARLKSSITEDTRTWRLLDLWMESICDDSRFVLFWNDDVAGFIRKHIVSQYKLPIYPLDIGPHVSSGDPITRLCHARAARRGKSYSDR